MSVSGRLQSILMPLTMSDQEQTDWLVAHGFNKTKKKHITEQYARYRLHNPKHQTDVDEQYRTIVLDQALGIKAIYEISNHKYRGAKRGRHAKKSVEPADLKEPIN